MILQNPEAVHIISEDENKLIEFIDVLIRIIKFYLNLMCFNESDEDTDGNGKYRNKPFQFLIWIFSRISILGIDSRLAGLRFP